MLNFTSYLNENATTKYVSVIYNQDTQTKLRNWAKENGFDLNVDFDGKPQKPENFEFHTTIFTLHLSMILNLECQQYLSV